MGRTFAIGSVVLVTSVLGGCSLTSADVDKAIDVSAMVCKVTPGVRVAAATVGITIPPKVTIVRGEICRRIAVLAGRG